MPLDHVDWEDFVVSQDPKFLAILERSRAGYKAQGGIPLEQMEAEFGLSRPAAKPRRKTVPARSRARGAAPAKHG